MSGSGISWAICKSAPCSRHITTPAPHHSVFYRPDALPAAQPTASKHWRHYHHNYRTIISLSSEMICAFRSFFSVFCTAHSREQQTNKLTRYFISRNRPHMCYMRAMQTSNKTSTTCTKTFPPQPNCVITLPEKSDNTRTTSNASLCKWL